MTTVPVSSSAKAALFFCLTLILTPASIASTLSINFSGIINAIFSGPALTVGDTILTAADLGSAPFTTSSGSVNAGDVSTVSLSGLRSRS